MSIDTIVAPHDGSLLSGSVVSALEPIIASGTTVTLLHVRGQETFDEAPLLEAMRTLEQYGATVRRTDVDSEDAAGAIVDTIASLRPDLVAMTTHGRSGLERWVRGSVAERVLRASPAPVFMVNPFAERATDVSSVLVPLDTSDYSAQVLGTVIPLAKAFNARLTLLFVDWDDPTDTPEGRAARRTQRAEDISSWLAKPRADAEAAGLTVALEITHGDVAEEILRLSHPAQHSLLAMTTHGRSGPSRWIFGSITEKVLRECRLPMVVARINKAT